MKTPNTNKLGFAKNSLVELNDNQLQDINGGLTPTLSLVVSITVAITNS